MPETVYYSKGSVLITNTRAVLGGKTYAVANVTSVAAEAVPRSRWWIALASLIGLTVFCLASSIMLWALSGSLVSDTSGIAAVILGVLLPFGLAVGLTIVLAKVLLRGPTTYSVRIGSASGETDALTSTDREDIQAIVDAMNQALIERG